MGEEVQQNGDLNIKFFWPRKANPYAETGILTYLPVE